MRHTCIPLLIFEILNLHSIRQSLKVLGRQRIRESLSTVHPFGFPLFTQLPITIMRYFDFEHFRSLDLESSD